MCECKPYIYAVLNIGKWREIERVRMIMDMRKTMKGSTSIGGKGVRQNSFQNVRNAMSRRSKRKRVCNRRRNFIVRNGSSSVVGGAFDKDADKSVFESEKPALEPKNLKRQPKIYNTVKACSTMIFPD